MTRPVFITRPALQAPLLAGEVGRRGFTPILAPCLDLEILPGPPLDDTGLAALAVTSANGAAALAKRFARRDLPLYAVGETTAIVARQWGFTRVESADGDGAALARLLAARCKGKDGAILYASGSDTAYDLGAALAPHALQVRQVAVYEMQVARSLPQAALDVLDAGAEASVLLMSARTARAFGDLVTIAGRDRALPHLTALCLSPAIADSARAYGFARVAAATEPSQAALLDLLETAPSGH